MRYSTNYDVGERKREDGINEDSIALAVFEQGHREGYRGEDRPLGDRPPDAAVANDDAQAGESATAEPAANDDRTRDRDEKSPDDGEVRADEAVPAEQGWHAEDRSDDEDVDGVDVEDEDERDAEAEDGVDAEAEDGADAEDVGGANAKDENGSDAEDVGGANAKDENGADAEDENGADAGDENEVAADTVDENARTAPLNRSGAAFALADGAGGHEAGDAASYIASAVAVEELASVAVRATRTDPQGFDLPEGVPAPERSTDEEMQGAVERAVVAAHRRVLEYAASEGTPAYTTIVAGVVADGRLHYGWVGDSRAYVVNRERGDLALLTKDHAVVEELADAGEVDEVEAHVHPRGNEITRAVGGAGDADPETAAVPVETASVPLYAEDVLVVTSDGLIDAQTDAPSLYEEYREAGRDEAAAETVLEKVVTDAQVRDLVLSASTLDELVDDAVELANDRGGKDNVSILALSAPSAPPTPADGGLPTRAADPDVPLEERETVLVPEK
ncbi:MAG: protein phosphatase 2C domain-containing protein [Haloarculaceae archaeon]